MKVNMNNFLPGIDLITVKGKRVVLEKKLGSMWLVRETESPKRAWKVTTEGLAIPETLSIDGPWNPCPLSVRFTGFDGSIFTSEIGFDKYVADYRDQKNWPKLGKQAYEAFSRKLHIRKAEIVGLTVWEEQ